MPSSSALAAAAVALPFAGALLIALLRAAGGRQGPAAAVTVATVTATAGVVGLLWLAAPGPAEWRADWLPAAGVGIGVRVDGLSVLFSVLLAGVGLLTTLFAVAYVPRMTEGRGRSSSPATCFAYLLAFQGSMLGLVFSANLVQFYVFWEMLDLAAFLMIGLDWRSARSRRNAATVLLFTTLGGLALLVGIVLLGASAGTFWITEVAGAGGTLAASPLFTPALLLVVLAALAKSAQFPLHGWLARAMVAPTPVNALDDSVLVPASGVLLLALVHPVFAGHPLWSVGLVGVGFATMLVAGVLAVGASDLKVLLARSTSSQFGFVWVLLGLGGDAALAAALLLVFHHAILKSGLFLSLGTVGYAAGTRDVGGAGLAPLRLPLVFGAACVLAASLAGVPPLGGFWSKEHFLEETLAAGGPLLATAAVLGSALTVTYMLRWLAGAFAGERSPPGGAGSTPTPPMVLVPGTLAVLTVVLGLFPAAAAGALIDPAAAVAAGAPPLVSEWKASPALLMSGAALALGALGFLLVRSREAAVQRAVGGLARMDRAFGWLADGVGAAGRWTLRLQNGQLLRYTSVTLAALVGLAGYALVRTAGHVGLPATSAATIDWRIAALLSLICAGTLLTFFVREHLQIVLLLGAVGYLIAGLFALALAPNLGLLQVHVETLVTVLLVLPLAAVPREVRQRLFAGPRERVTAGRLALAGAMGIGTAWVSWMAIEHLPADPVAPWYADNAPERVGATDIVAAVLIEFRALDTFGEIIVFATAAIGVLVLGQMIRREKP